VAVFIYTNSKVTLNGTANDVSSSVKQITLDIDVDEQETTNFGSLGYKEFRGGLKAGKVTIDFIDDVASGGIDSAIYALLGSTAAFTIKPGGTAANGTSNPEYQGTVLVSKTSTGGAVGDLATKSVTWPTTGTITRATA